MLDKKMNSQLVIERIYSIGNTGFYINPKQIAHNIDNWRKNTPKNVRHKQIRDIALFGLVLCGIILITNS